MNPQEFIRNVISLCHRKQRLLHEDQLNDRSLRIRSVLSRIDRRSVNTSPSRAKAQRTQPHGFELSFEAGAGWRRIVWDGLRFVFRRLRRG